MVFITLLQEATRLIPGAKYVADILNCFNAINKYKNDANEINQIY